MSQETRSDQASVAKDSQLDDGRLLRLVHDAIIMSDLAGVVHLWNPGAERVYGYSSAEMTGKPLTTVYFPEDLSGIPAGIANPVQFAANGASLTEAIVRRRHKDGRPLTISLRIAEIRDSAGALTGFITCSNDITRRRVAEEALLRAHAELEQRVAARTRELSAMNIRLREQIAERRSVEEALRSSRERLDHLLLSSPGVLYSCGTPGSLALTFVSPNALQVLGYPAADYLAPQFWLDRIHPDDRSAALKLRESAVRDGRHCGEYRFEHADGTWRVIRDSAVVTLGLSGQPVEIVGYWLDITAERRAEETQREQERLRLFAEALLAAQEGERRRVSRELHDDLNQRLASLILDIGLLEKGLPESPAQIRRRLTALRKSAAGISDSVRAIALQLYSAGLEQFGLAAVLEEECASLQRRSGIRIRFNGTAVNGSLPENVSLCLYRVSQECLRNVIRHSGAQRVSVTLEDGIRSVRLCVEDDGVGFSPEEKSGRRSLGLTSINDRVKLLSGLVTVDSRIGRGTRIEVTLPLGTNS
jgi:PAS domain S-box-containing protein